MRITTTVLVLTLCMMVLSSCATLDKEECLTADWYTIGFEDGSKGYALNYLANHRKACAEHGVTPNFDQYNLGHNKGTDSFCVPDRALRMAADGHQFPLGCTTESYPQFANAFKQGEQVFMAKQAVYDIEQALHDIENAIEELKQQIEDNEAAIISDTTSRKERRQLLNDNKVLQEDVEALLIELVVLSERLNEKEYELRQLLEHYGLTGLHFG
ncbi:MAG: hypothetical protein AXW14_03535 [Alteromonas sp. Nap_26]|nr:MAG: hypothetical protein AXW14_03535 [Alteromonas sp. Nap_26]